MRASLKNTIAGSLAALAIGVGLASVATPASAWYRGGGFHGGFHGGWRGGVVGWHGYGWRGGCYYGAWRCGGYWGATPVVSYVPAPIPAPAPVALVDAPAPAPVPNCGVVYRPVFDADGTNVGTRAVNTCQ